jgi:hypothetical protein
MHKLDAGKPGRRIAPPGAALLGRAAVLACAATALAGLALVGCGSAGMAIGTATGPVVGSPVPAAAVPRLRVIADRIAKGNGDAAPQWVSAVVTTHAKALTSATPGDTEPGGQTALVYLLTMKGRFAANGVPTPSGSPTPTGRYLSIVVSAKNFEVSDFGLSGKPPPVSPASLGPVTCLKR